MSFMCGFGCGRCRGLGVGLSVGLGVGLGVGFGVGLSNGLRLGLGASIGVGRAVKGPTTSSHVGGGVMGTGATGDGVRTGVAAGTVVEAERGAGVLLPV